MKKTNIQFITGLLLAMTTGYTVKAQSPDGPYVFHLHDTIAIRQVLIKDGKPAPSEEIHIGTNPGTIHIVVPASDTVKNGFELDLQPTVSVAPSTYDRPKKMFVLSDIEGEFGAFRNLMIGNGVMDDKYNWTFGEGHLVICGDLFDRGTHVVEYLWLLYKLEQDAKSKGGMVHVILGNHDIMNLSGDFRYVQPKYFQTAALLGVQYKDLYGPNTELGRWLRSKNIVEKMGDILFLHAGIAPEINRIKLSIQEINDSTRPFYDMNAESLPLKQYFLLADDLAPIWYRGYFTGTRAMQSQVDSTLSLYGVKQIIVGHTVLPQITPYYNGAVIGIDVNQHEGNSQALIIEGDQIYIVDPDGHKMKIKG